MPKKHTVDELPSSLQDLERENQYLRDQLKIFEQKVYALTEPQSKYNIKSGKKDTYRFGLTSDLHLGSMYCNSEALVKFYKYCSEQGVTDFLCAGDLLDGGKIYKGQEFELREVGFERQLNALKEVVDQFPKKAKTYFITGNHDTSFSKEIGFNVGAHLEKELPNFHFVGRDVGQLIIETKSSDIRIALLHPAGGTAYALCFSEDTEILTEDGWIPFPELSRDVRVATLNQESRALEWQLPTAYTDEIYTGEMFHFKGNQYDHLVTPEHRFFARRPWDRWDSSGCTGSKKNTGPQMVSAKDIRGRDWVIPKSCSSYPSVDFEAPVGEDVLAFAELVGWYVAEGSRSDANQQIQIDQQDAENMESIIEVIGRCGMTHYKRPDMDRVVVSYRPFYRWIQENCPGKSDTKRVPRTILNSPPEILDAFMRGYLGGDGCLQERGWHSCTTVSKGLADDIQEIALRLGYAATIGSRPPQENLVICGTPVKTTLPSYQVSFNYRFLEPALSKPTSIGYSGRIYCVSVPNQIIMVRRNGKCSWSGNSYRPQKIIESWEGGKKPHLVCIGHYHKAEFIPKYRNVSCLQAGCFQNQTPFMQRLGTPAHVGGWIVSIAVGELYNKINAEFISFF